MTLELPVNYLAFFFSFYAAQMTDQSQRYASNDAIPLQLKTE